MSKQNLITFNMIAFSLLSCHSKPRTYVNMDVYQRLQSLCSQTKKTDLVVYYFDGDCSMCVAKVGFIERSLMNKTQELSLIFIAKTMNPALLYFNLTKLKVSSCVYVEKNGEFEKNLDFMKITKITPDREAKNYDNFVSY